MRTTMRGATCGGLGLEPGPPCVSSRRDLQAGPRAHGAARRARATKPPDRHGHGIPGATARRVTVAVIDVAPGVHPDMDDDRPQSAPIGGSRPR